MEILSWGELTLAIDSAQRATFTDWQRKASYKTETKENGTSWPKTSNKGPELGTISLNVLLMRRMGVDVRATLDGWISACNSGKADVLKVGGARIGQNKWQLRSVEEKEVIFDAGIKPAQALMSVTFQEYYAGGTSSSSSGSKKTSSSGGKSTSSKQTSSSKTPKPVTESKPASSSSGVDITQKYNELKKQKTGAAGTLTRGRTL